MKGKETLPLADIREDTPEGKALLAAARQILVAAGKPDAKEITLDDVADLSNVFEKTLFNGDGVVVPESAPEGDVRQVIVDAMACEGEVADRSGKPGLDRAQARDLLRRPRRLRRLVEGGAWSRRSRSWATPPRRPSTPSRRSGPRWTTTSPAPAWPRIDDRMPPLLARPDAEIAAMAGKDLSPGQRRGLHASRRADRGRAPPAARRTG